MHVYFIFLKECFEEAIIDSSSALDLHPHYLKAMLRRAELYEKTDKLDEALKDYQKVVELDPSQHAARASCLVSTGFVLHGFHQISTCFNVFYFLV